MYVDDFQSAVKQEPQAMIELVLAYKDRVLSAFIESLFSGVELSEHLKEIEPKKIENMFHTFPCDLKTHRASYFCEYEFICMVYGSDGAVEKYCTES